MLESPTTDELLMRLVLYVILPLWGIAGFVDWWCHRASRIESNAGWRESLLHTVMGIQVGIPIILALTCRVNVLVYAICVVAWAMHEVVAHMDVRYAAPRRNIGIWEVHAHNYLATIPLYLLALITVINWTTVTRFVSLNWRPGLRLEPHPTPIGGSSYLVAYLSFMAVLCVFPYLEEMARCLRYARSR